jgi:hypothetical protein
LPEILHVPRPLNLSLSGPPDKSRLYNRTRAALKLAALSLDAGQQLSERELIYLVTAYHFLFNERVPALFDRCHDALWRAFENRKDLANLLTLFRYRSLYWRLKGRDKIEARYLKKLAKSVGDTISRKVSTLTREAAYYLVRASAQKSAARRAAEEDIQR